MEKPAKPATVMVFDLGKVLVNFDWMIVINKFSKRTGKSLADFQQLLSNPQLLLDYETGLITSSEFYQRVRDLLGYQESMDTFKEDFCDMFTEIPAMTSLQKSIREHGIPTYILSNTNELAIEFIESHFPFFKNFDGYIYSYAEKSMKPEPAIYLAMENLCGTSGSDILFLDDNQANVDGARALGWQAYLHTSPESSAQIIKDAGLLP